MDSCKYQLSLPKADEFQVLKPYMENRRWSRKHMQRDTDHFEDSHVLDTLKTTGHTKIG